MTEKVLGTDTSHWAGSINFDTMYNAGARFWITKATDAYISSPIQYEDTRFMAFSKAAIAHGKLLTGCYHWLQASIDPKVAADYYLERYNRFPFDFPPILDFEEQNVFITGKYSDFAWRAQTWLDYVGNKTGRTPIIYTGKWYTDHFNLKYIQFMNKYPLWVADYTWKSNTLYNRPTYMPAPWTAQTIWQFSADGNGRGKEFGTPGGSIDLNWFEGDLETLRAFLEIVPEPIPPETNPEPQPIDISAELAVIRGKLNEIEAKARL